MTMQRCVDTNTSSIGKAKCAGRKWLKGFMKRNPNLSIKTNEGHSLSRAQGLNRDAVSDFYNLLHDMLKYDLLNIPKKHLQRGLVRPLFEHQTKQSNQRENRDCAITNK